MEGEVACNNTSLVLGLGCGDFAARPKPEPRSKRPVQFHVLFPPCSVPSAADDGSSSKNMQDDEGESAVRTGEGTRKKLRLTKEQSSLLEESFKEHSTLTPAQKKELAGRLNLRERQVEVWFQNRRARTKLKRTEVDCALLKKCCESLSDENRRLKKELQELKSIKHGPPFFLQLSKTGTGAGPTSLRLCPSCEQAVFASGGKTVKTENLDSSMAR